MATNVTLERHIQTGLAVILIGFVGWVGMSVSANTTLTARLEERVALLTQQMQELRNTVNTKMADRFTGQEGILLKRRISELESIAREHEERLDNLEKK